MRAQAGLGAFLFLTTVLVACSGAPGDDATGSDEALSDAKKKDAGADSGAKDAGVDSGKDSGAGSSGGDGTPVRNACTSKFGKALSGSFGRLDGTIVSIVVPGGSKSCNGDSTHVHLQVLMGGAIYDVAANIDGGYFLEKDIPLPDGAWSEGWHPSDGLDYSKTLGIKSTDFTAVAQKALTTEVEAALASANHISVFGTTYTGSDAGSGIHDIHRQSTNKDGAIFIDPTSSKPEALLFRFSTDKF